MYLKFVSPLVHLVAAHFVRGFAPFVRTTKPATVLSSRPSKVLATSFYFSHKGHCLHKSRSFPLRASSGSDDDNSNVESNVLKSRRQTLTTALTALTAATTVLSSPLSAEAYYDKNYPEELVLSDGEDLDGRARKKNQVMAQEAERTAAVTLGPTYKPVSAALWGAALWLLSGSRSNPVVTPLANVVYNQKDEKWLRDRNEGLFADMPIPLLVILAVVFCAVGWGVDTLIVQLADGDRNISLQLAGVSLISGASLELGRIASGEKAPTRDEADRDGQLAQEFAEFAEKRLQPGGNCHRSEVVRAFRRYFAKYRQVDSEEYPLADLEIERLLKRWTARMPNVEMTSAGFYYGIQINKDADVLA